MFGKKRRSVVNTQKQAREDPFMKSWVLGGNPNAILAQEATGQQSFVVSETLPTDMKGDAIAVLNAAGMKFLGVVKDDPMFQYVELPAGWKKIATDHSMWSDLVDDKGRKRAGIFYKAAYYDRRAHLSVNLRYGISIDYVRLDTERVAVAMVTEDEAVVFTTDPVGFEDDKTRYYAQDKARELASAWLSEHYPNWKNPSAYWD